MCSFKRLLICLFLFLPVFSVDVASAQDKTAPPLGAGILPPIIDGLKSAKQQMSKEDYDQCFFAGIFISDFLRDAKIRSTGQSLAETVDAFACELSKPVFSNIYYVLGTIGLSGKVHRYEVHIDETESSFGDGKSWSFAYLEIDRRELYRREGFEPILIGRK